MYRLPHYIMGIVILALSAKGAASDSIIEWVSQHQTPIVTAELSDDYSDMVGFDNVIRNARVVSFGEGAHDTHELWSFRNRLFAYLVETKGFTALAAETGFLQSIDTDNYILGKNGSSYNAAHGVFSWTDSVFNENLELVSWMKAYNNRPSTQRKVRFYGLEMSGHMAPDGKPLIEAAVSYIHSVSPELYEPLRQRFEPYLSKFNQNGFSTLTGQQSNSLLVETQDLISLFERWQVVWALKSSSLDFQRAYRCAIAARQLIAHARMYGEGRDIAAAENLRWVLEQEGPQSRIMVFAHNSHVKKWRKPPENYTGLHSTMGEFTNLLLGSDMAVIGSLYHEGKARDLLGLFRDKNTVYDVAPSKIASLNGVFSKVGPPAFLLNLNTLPRSSDIRQWFNAPIAIRNLNVRAGYNTAIPAKAFDALLFLKNITPLKLIPKTQETLKVNSPRKDGS